MSGRKDEQPEQHTWHVAAWVAVTDIEARLAARRGRVRLLAGTQVEVCETVCLRCRRPFDEVVGTACVDREAYQQHLIGGHPGERRKRPRRSPGVHEVEWTI